MSLKGLHIVPLTDYKDTDVETVGSSRIEPDGKRYRWVKNSTGGALVANRAYFFGTADLGTDYVTGDEVFTLGQASKGTGINLFAGLAMSAIPDGEFGWIQTYGYNANGPVEGTTAVAATDNLKGVSGQTYLVKDVAAGTAPTNDANSVALAAQATAAVVATPIIVRGALL